MSYNSDPFEHVQRSTNRIPQEEIELIRKLGSDRSKANAVTFESLALEGLKDDVRKLQAELASTGSTKLSGELRAVAACHPASLAAALRGTPITTLQVTASAQQDLTTQTEAATSVLEAVFRRPQEELGVVPTPSPPTTLVVPCTSVAVALLQSMSLSTPEEGKGLQFPCPRFYVLSTLIVEGAVLSLDALTELLTSVPPHLDLRIVLKEMSAQNVTLEESIEFQRVLQKSKHVMLEQEVFATSSPWLEHVAIGEHRNRIPSSLHHSRYEPVASLSNIQEMAIGVGYERLVPVSRQGLQHSKVVKGMMGLHLTTKHRSSKRGRDDETKVAATCPASSPQRDCREKEEEEDEPELEPSSRIVPMTIDDEPPGLLAVQCMAAYLDQVAASSHHDNDSSDDADDSKSSSGGGGADAATCTLGTSAADAEQAAPSDVVVRIMEHDFGFLLHLQEEVGYNKNRYIQLLTQLLQLSIYFNIPTLKQVARSGLVVALGPLYEYRLPNSLVQTASPPTILNICWSATRRLGRLPLQLQYHNHVLGIVPTKKTKNPSKPSEWYDMVFPAECRFPQGDGNGGYGSTSTSPNSPRSYLLQFRMQPESMRSVRVVVRPPISHKAVAPVLHQDGDWYLPDGTKEEFESRGQFEPLFLGWPLRSMQGTNVKYVSIVVNYQKGVRIRAEVDGETDGNKTVPDGAEFEVGLAFRRDDPLAFIHPHVV